MSTLAELRRMQIQISTIMNCINKHNKRDYTYSFNVRYLEYVINHSFRRKLRELRNLHGKPQVTRNFATLCTSDKNVLNFCEVHA